MKNSTYQINKPTKNDTKFLTKKDFTSSVAKWAVHLSPYSCPDDLTRVIIKADGAWPTNSAIESTYFMREWSYDEFKDFVHSFIFSTSEILAWNNAKTGRSGHKFVSLYDAPSSPNDDFIDLDALKMNIVSDCWSKED